MTNLLHSKNIEDNKCLMCNLFTVQSAYCIITHSSYTVLYCTHHILHSVVLHTVLLLIIRTLLSVVYLLVIYFTV